MGTVHVLPINDLKEHSENEECECKPKVKYVDGGMVIVHNSYDGREVWEQWEDSKTETVQ